MFRWLTSWFDQKKASALFEASVLVEDNGEEITSTYPDGTVQRINWNAVETVEIHTNDSGPWGADVWWLLRSSNTSCSYPQGATGEIELISKLQTLPGFNNREFIEAMGCTSNRKFVCWQKQKAT